MVVIKQATCKTRLKDRDLWFDGDISVSPELLVSMLMKGIDINSLFTTEITPDIRQYNNLATRQISVKEGINSLNFEWNFGKSYQQIDVEDFVLECLEQEIQHFSKSEQSVRIKRTIKELELFKQHSFMTVLKLMVFIIDVFEQQNIVWGVGRGSSVSSYVLYLIGVHDIDSVEYNLPIEDFFHSH
jgi:DNA polymerase III alpha subunit